MLNNLSRSFSHSTVSVGYRSTSSSLATLFMNHCRSSLIVVQLGDVLILLEHHLQASVHELSMGYKKLSTQNLSSILVSVVNSTNALAPTKL